MAGVAEDDGDRLAVEVVDADDTDGRVDRVVGYFAQHVAAVAVLAPIDADGAFAPTAADPRRLQPRIRLHRGLHESAAERVSVALLQRHLLRRVGHVVGQRHARVRVTRVEEHVCDGDAQRLRDPVAELLGGPLATQ